MLLRNGYKLSSLILNKDCEIVLFESSCTKSVHKHICYT
uniref:Uncharacterized protein n=1 Tax=Rhizophora mucronata TaxID=61149 RepID=A0A2P2Q924_RHIMU